MSISNLHLAPPYAGNRQALKQAVLINELISEINTKNISKELKDQFRQDLNELHDFSGKARKLAAQIRKKRNKWLDLLLKEHGLVSKGYYQNFYMPVGMTAIGLPLGVIISNLSDNTGYIALGLPIGMIAGMIYGMSRDTKAKREGRQLKYTLIR